jgi:uncharacterized protein (TIGR03437 family)
MFIRSRFIATSVITGLTFFAATADAQQSRIGARISNSATVVIRHHVPARALRALDQGPVAASFNLPSVTMYLQASASQQASLHQLLASQKVPGSGNYHKWLTPEQYADQFGVSAADAGRITAWLESQGLHVEQVARSRTFIRFSGAADKVEAALHTQIDQFLENGKVHYSNVNDPSVPAALAGIVRSFGGLHDFRLKPRSVLRRAGAEFTSGAGQHQIVPDDFAVLYNVAPLYAAGIDGTGQKQVVIGQTQINMSDITTFRSKYGLPVNNPQLVLVPRSPNPGISQDDLPEADLDLEWSGAVARNASIIYVYSDDVNTSVTDAIDEAYAPVISMSYGLCEGNDTVDLPTYQALALQANAEGITWLNASGDSGAGDCEDSDALIAQDGPQVDSPASVPEVTSMGGTEFSEGDGSYWSSTNTAAGASALSYIPERVWNDTGLGFGFSAGGGGTSIFFPKPLWQTGAGVPDNAFRNVPDVSIASSADHDGYNVLTGGRVQVYGGTSMAAPTMAGIVTLLNQYLVLNKVQAQPGLGNINPQLYRLASVGGVFHDVTVGNNSLPCVGGSPGCVNGTFGFSAGPGYDRATGVGSPDAFNLVHAWTAQAATTSAVVGVIDQNPVFRQTADASGNQWRFTFTLSEEAGVAATVTAFSINGTPYDVATVFGTANIPAGGSISSSNLGLANLAVPANVVFAYSGTDALGNTWSHQLTIPFDGPQPQLIVGGVSNAATGEQSYAPGMLVSVYGTAMGNFVQSAGTIPLPQFLAGFEAEVNGTVAALYYVSPNQVNLQIPYETQPGNATLTVGNPYVNVNYRLKIVAAAPGIFTSNGFIFPPFSSAKQGTETALYITGEGQVSPGVSDGDSPSASTPMSRLPKPKLPVTVTVGNENANIVFIGIPPGLVGVTQINFTVPADVPVGAQDVVVTVGTVASPAAKLNVTQ